MDSGHSKAPGIYYPALDTLRGFFSLVVFAFHIALELLSRLNPTHYPELVAGPVGFGAFGVPFFFVLSSFLITNLLLEEIERTGAVEVKGFYTRRILRVWPVYFLTLFAGVFVVEPLSGQPQSFQWLVPYGLFFANNLLGGTRLPRESMGIAPLWSVSVEEQFYLVWPWVVKALRAKWVGWAGLALVVAAPVIRCSLFFRGVDTHVLHWYSTWTHFDALGAGVLACVAHRKGLFPVLKRHLTAVALISMAVAMMVQLGTGTLMDFRVLNLAGVAFYSLVPLAGGVLVFAAAQPSDQIPRAWTNPVGLWFGKISYSLYALHGFGLLLILKRTGSEPVTVIIGTIATVVLTIGLAALAYTFIERPTARLRGRFQVVRSGPA